MVKLKKIKKYLKNCKGPEHSLQGQNYNFTLPFFFCSQQWAHYPSSAASLATITKRCHCKHKQQHEAVALHIGIPY